MNIKATLITRLSAAAGFLLGARYPDSSEAVKEAIEVIRAVPYGEAINAALYPTEDIGRRLWDGIAQERKERFRALRKFHYDEAMDYAQRATQLQKRSDGRIFERESRDAFERTAQEYRRKSNQHLRYVQTLNELFPEDDRVQ